MNIGKNIYELRKAKKLTQGQLAEKLGVSEQAVSKWENNVCAPDVGMFPRVAKLFGVSIDRIYGFYLTDSDDEVTKIIEAADESMDTYREIEIITEGLKRFPNSARLKNYLAFSYAMVHRIAETEEEKTTARQKSLSLCEEVLATSGDEQQIDSALVTMSRLYIDAGDFSAATDAIQKMSAGNYYGRIAYTAAILARQNDIGKHLTFVEESLFSCWLAMCHSVDGLVHRLADDQKDYGRALEFQKLHLKLLELFDDGLKTELKNEGQVFYATSKMFLYEKCAEIHRNLGNKPECLDALRNFFGIADAVRAVAKSEDFHLSARNTYFAEATKDDMQEEYMSEVSPERVLKKYEVLLGDEPEFQVLKETT